MNKSFSLTVNGQPVKFAVQANGDVHQTSDYYRHGKRIGISGYGGYESERIHVVSTRTIANMVERFMKTNA